MTKKISKKFSFIGENIRRIRQTKNISQAEFATLFGLGRPAVGAYEEGRSEPKIDSIIKMSKYFSISIDALLTKQLTVAEIYSFDRLNKKLDLVHGKKNLKSGSEGIPMVRITQNLDYVIRHNDPEFIQSLEKVHSHLNVTNLRVFEMKGNDMDNQGHGLNPGDFLFCSKLDLKKVKEVKNEVMVVITDDEVCCKRLERFREDTAVFSSDSKGVGDLEKSIEEIAEVWLVKGHYSEKISPPSKLEDRINQLEETVKNLGG